MLVLNHASPVHSPDPPRFDNFIEVALLGNILFLDELMCEIYRRAGDDFVIC